jgi:vacuolar-type H+-ATPase subunit D/Vma8
MLKVELQKAYDKLKRGHNTLTILHDAAVRLAHAYKGELAEERDRYVKLHEEYVAVEESEHAIRCIRLPYVELENEKLKDQVSRLLKKTREVDIAYKDLASAFQTFIQRTQTEDFIWRMRDPKVPRDD